MTIQNTDIFLVNRGNVSYKEDYNSIKQDILDDVPAAATPTLAEVTTAGATTTNAVTVGDLTADAGVFGERVSGAMGSIPNGDAWDLATTNLWTAVGGEIINPASMTAGQSGLIFTSAEVTTWGDAFDFPGGAIPTVPANSVIPYYVATANTILMGRATEAIS